MLPLIFHFLILPWCPPKILSRKNHPGSGSVPAHPARGCVAETGHSPYEH
jgi:hypothetical protein